MKIGIDFHNTIDSDYFTFSEFTNALVKSGIEIHILTGPKREEVEPLLKQHNIAYTHFFSIVEDAEKNDMTIKWDLEGHPWINPEFWNRSKARYCKEHDIDLHLDDSREYGKYFKTPYAQFKGK